ncbi:3-oxoadipate--succinyl-CoA transferase subunit A, partial [Xanthomonas perforans]
WDAIARDRATFQAWIQTHILDTDDFAGFQRVYAQSQQQVAA